MLDSNFVNEILEYKDGSLYWKKTKLRSTKKAGDIAGCIGTLGYRRIKINKKTYREHRLIFLMHHNYLPKYVDHIDGNILNNKIENLREATAQQNSANQKIAINNTSGHKGIYFNKNNKKRPWKACIRFESKLYYLGSFYIKEKAIEAYELKNIELNKEFARNK
jgi:HNH endonuclease